MSVSTQLVNDFGILQKDLDEVRLVSLHAIGWPNLDVSLAKEDEQLARLEQQGWIRVIDGQTVQMTPEGRAHALALLQGQLGFALEPVQIREEVTEKGRTRRASSRRRGNFYEYTSHRQLFGMPFLSITRGIDPTTGKHVVARGFIAIGRRAEGFVAIGQMATGRIVAIGQLAIGGVVSIGQASVAGIFALGQVAVAPVAIGQIVLGILGLGQAGLALYGEFIHYAGFWPIWSKPSD